MPSPHSTEPPPAARRWVVLGLFMAVAAISQALALNFAPLVTEVQQRYGVGELAAASLTLVFPLVYVLLSAHAGRLTDRRGYRTTIGLGAVVLAVFSLLRIHDASFGMLLLAQTGAAVGQPYVVNGISRLVADWFPPQQSALATGLGTMGMFIGLAVAVAATPPLVDALGWTMTMAVYAACSVIAALAFLCGPEERSVAGAAAAHVPLAGLLKRRQLLLLFIVSFLGQGFFNGLFTWIEPILAPQGFDAGQAGAAGGLLIVGGIVGSVAIPALADALQRRKPLLVLCLALSLVLFVPVVTSASMPVVLASAAAMGFFFFPALALSLDMCAANAGPADTGSATGLLMMFGNGGGVVIALLMLVAKGDAPTFAPALLLLAAAIGLAIGVGLLVRETAPGRAVAQRLGNAQ